MRKLTKEYADELREMRVMPRMKVLYEILDTFSDGAMDFLKGNFTNELSVMSMVNWHCAGQDTSDMGCLKKFLKGDPSSPNFVLADFEKSLNDDKLAEKASDTSYGELSNGIKKTVFQIYGFHNPYDKGETRVKAKKLFLEQWDCDPNITEAEFNEKFDLTGDVFIGYSRSTWESEFKTQGVKSELGFYLGAESPYKCLSDSVDVGIFMKSKVDLISTHIRVEYNTAESSHDLHGCNTLQEGEDFIHKLIELMSKDVGVAVDIEG